MIITDNISKIRAIVYKAKKRNKRIGFVPTMGGLHSGHIFLVKKAKKECDLVMVSIFVNPTQFGPKEDYKKYPRTFKKDKELLKKEMVDLLFHPKAKVMYPESFSTFVDETYLSKVLCGESRVGHFKGVCTVIVKLFNIVQPDRAYFGQKDYQQAEIVKQMVKDLNYPIEIEILPTVRENDGLAISSRNAYLNKYERRQAPILFKALKLAQRSIMNGEKKSQKIVEQMKRLIASEPAATIDYVRIIDSKSLRDVNNIESSVVIALAVFIGETRLIDNVIVNEEN